MGLTVIVNNMTVSHKGSSGISTAFPDVCKTPFGFPVEPDVYCKKASCPPKSAGLRHALESKSPP